MRFSHQSRSGAALPGGGPDVTARWSAAARAALRRPGPRSMARDDEAAAARAFYRDALGGSEVWRTGAVEPRRALSFIIRGTLVDVSLDARAARAAAGPIELYVDDPEVLAERCWDAGYVVRVYDDATGEAHLSVMDPFGRRVDLLARRTHEGPRIPAGEEEA